MPPTNVPASPVTVGVLGASQVVAREGFFPAVGAQVDYMLSYPAIDAAGDLLVGVSDDIVTKLPVGANGKVLTVASGLPSWQDPATGVPALVNGKWLAAKAGAMLWDSPAIADITGLQTQLTALARPQVTYGSTPPASPADSDIWMFPADATNGVIWQFRYRTAATTYKWEFVGGSPLFNKLYVQEGTASSTYVALTTPLTLVLPRAGDYLVEVGAHFVCAAVTNSLSLASYSIGATAANDAWAASVGQWDTASPRTFSDVSMPHLQTGVAASSTVTAQYRQSGGGTGTWGPQRWLVATPVRVS